MQRVTDKVSKIISDFIDLYHLENNLLWLIRQSLVFCISHAISIVFIQEGTKVIGKREK
jgi:hypothetical protein